MKNSLEARMKKYEKITNFQISPRTYTIIRFDGRGFSKYTKGMNKPFDKVFSDAMNAAAIAIGKSFHGKLVYTQSDEISILLTDIDNIDSELPFDGKIQKLASIGATIVANAFNKSLINNIIATGDDNDKIIGLIQQFSFGEFDARVFSIPDFREVSNYFIWRQQDCTRNSISMAAHAVKGLSHKDRENKNTTELQELLFQNGINWNDYPEKYKRGVIVIREKYKKEVVASKENYKIDDFVIRSRWACIETPIFTQDKEFLYNLIPVIS